MKPRKRTATVWSDVFDQSIKPNMTMYVLKEHEGTKCHTGKSKRHKTTALQFTLKNESPQGLVGLSADDMDLEKGLLDTIYPKVDKRY